MSKSSDDLPNQEKKSTETLIHGRAEQYMQKWGPNFLANLKRVKVGAKTNNRWE